MAESLRGAAAIREMHDLLPWLAMEHLSSAAAAPPTEHKECCGDGQSLGPRHPGRRAVEQALPWLATSGPERSVVPSELEAGSGEGAFRGINIGPLLNRLSPTLDLILESLGPDEPSTRGQRAAPLRPVDPDLLLRPTDEPDRTRLTRRRLVGRLRPASVVLAENPPCSDGISVAPSEPVGAVVVPVGTSTRYPTYSERLDYVLRNSSGSAYVRLMDTAYPDPNIIRPFPLDGFETVVAGERNFWWRRFIARWWLYGAPKKCPEVGENWIRYRGHWIRRNGDYGHTTAQRYEVMLAIDLARINARLFEDWTFTLTNGTVVPYGSGTRRVIRGTEAVAFVTLASGHPFLTVGDAVGLGGYWDLSRDENTHAAAGFRSWVVSLNLPSDVQHLIMVSRELWEGGVPGSLGDSPPDPDSKWLLPRRQEDVAQTLRWTASLSDTYLQAMDSRGYPTPFSDGPAREIVPFALVSSVSDRYNNDNLLQWLVFYNTVLHEFFHAGFAAENRRSAGDPCDMDIDPRVLAQVVPTPPNSMTFHAAVQSSAAEAAEWVVFGKRIGYLFTNYCCAEGSGAFPGAESCP